MADKDQDIALCNRGLKHNFGGIWWKRVFGPAMLFKELEIDSLLYSAG